MKRIMKNEWFSIWSSKFHWANSPRELHFRDCDVIAMDLGL